MADKLGISSGEYRQRWDRLRAKMKHNGCDMFIAYGDDHSFAGQGHVRYLCDYFPHIEPAVVVLTLNDPPVLFTGPESLHYALLSSKIEDVQAVSEFELAGQDYPTIDVQPFGAVLDSRFGRQVKKAKRYAVAGKTMIPHVLFEKIRAIFAGLEELDGEDWMTELRMVKSPDEIGIIEKAYTIAEVGMRACIGAVKTGVSEHQIAAEGEYAMRKLGAERTGFDTVVGSGQNSRPTVARTTFRCIAENDLIALSIGPRLMGYHAQLGRPVYCGEDIPHDISDAIRAAVEALELTQGAMRPGAVAEEVEAVGRRHVAKAGLGDYYIYSSCHSVGTVEAEEPILGPGNQLRLQEGMVFNIDIPIFLAPFGGFRVEDGFLVTLEGARRLSKLELGPIRKY